VSKISTELFAPGAKAAGGKLKLFSPMRLVTYDAGAGPHAGILHGERVHGAWPGDVAALLRGSGIDDLDADDDGVALSDVRLLAPILTPSKIVCLGLNYRSHAEEAGMEAPKTTTAWRFRTSGCWHPS
jgi:2-keto-4-pentenoate hydratase/2-oxohepta-3-ene-1,7-dioic acid hydratase in catechol pathway